MPVPIHNKSYRTVAERVNDFRTNEEYKGWTIETEILRFEDDDCIIKATISNPEGRVVATGLAHEIKGSTNINKTSHVENCETSAIGRALASLGLAGTEYASADEVSTAIIQQSLSDVEKKFALHTKCLLANHAVIMGIKQGIAEDDWASAAEDWFTLDDETKATLWVAPSKGGAFTTSERDVIKHADFRKAYYGEDA